jgi:hypothetical protein
LTFVYTKECGLAGMVGTVNLCTLYLLAVSCDSICGVCIYDGNFR